ncbi:MAG: 8-oxo-dGTP diphosphatase [Lachnospiraceae bacterium]|nr:8-oxo-dGTP diphosphatase [Lachnospiraceae bacterium]
MDMRSNLTTLCYIENEDSYLMLHRVKKEVDINKDKWIGVGGHFEAGESPEECLLREVYEETGLTLTSWRLRGIITFSTDTYSTEYMFLYTADEYTGVMTDCNEGTLEWVRKEAVCELPIWEGDKIFFRLLEEDADFFSLKMHYEGDRLVEAVLDGRDLLKAEAIETAEAV